MTTLTADRIEKGLANEDLDFGGCTVKKTKPNPRTRKTELAAVRIERPLLAAMQTAAKRLEINQAEFMRRALLRECERLGVLPLIY